MVGWGGLVAVVSSILLLSPSAHFPGWIALWPVFGTVAVVLAGVGATLLTRMVSARARCSATR